ncbi:MAG: YdeI/OmpD-associated family protein [Bacteroidota bacterium]
MAIKKKNLTMSKDADSYFTDGCGRCPFFKTPQCKVQQWKNELKAIRNILLESGLNEESKWGVPCYTHNNKNVIMIAAFREYCGISFFKGALLSDPHKLLEFAGENSQSSKLLKFTNVKQVEKLEKTIKEYIQEAILVEDSGMKVEFKKITEHKIPEELEVKFKKDAAFKKAFHSLTPGRQRGYLIYFSQPKQSKTKEERIEKCVGKIMKGKGMQD